MDCRNFSLGRDPLICPSASIADFLDGLPQNPPGPTACGYAATWDDPPFPVEVPYQVRPDLQKLGDRPLVIVDDQWSSWVAQKRHQIRAGTLPLVGAAMSAEALSHVTGLLSRWFWEQVPNGPLRPDGSFGWIGGVKPRSDIEFLVGLTLSLQEDFAVMIPDADGSLRAQILSVYFASGWSPKEKLGQSMAAIHEPVAENRALMKSTAAMSQAMVSKGPFVRYVWTLAGSDALARAPGQDTMASVARWEDLWFRSERQITVPLWGRASLFLIRVDVRPLVQMVETPERRAVLEAALRSMSPEVLAYKSIERAARLILERALLK